MNPDREELTPDEIAVLRAIDTDGIDAFEYMTEEQKQIATFLCDDVGLLTAFGDEYDFNWYLSTEGESVLWDIDHPESESR